MTDAPHLPGSASLTCRPSCAAGAAPFSPRCSTFATIPLPSAPVLERRSAALIVSSALPAKEAACKADVRLTAFEKPNGRCCGVAAGCSSARRCLSAFTAASALRRSYGGRK